MLDLADVVAINKFDRRGRRGRPAGGRAPVAPEPPGAGRPMTRRSSAPIAARFNDDGVTALYQHLRAAAGRAGPGRRAGRLLPGAAPGPRRPPPRSSRPTRRRYLAEIAEAVRATTADTGRSRRPSAALQQLDGRWPWRRPVGTAAGVDVAASTPARRSWPGGGRDLDPAPPGCWPSRRPSVRPASPPVWARGRPGDRAGARPALPVRAPGSPAWPCPGFTDDGELLRWLRAENLPGHFPFTAGVFPFKREGEDPARMFAGEGDPFRTNRRFHLLGRGPAGHPAVHRVRLGHPLRLRPRHPSRHLRQDRHLRGVGRHPRRHGGPLRRLRPVRPHHVGVDDHQRAGPDHPGHVPQRRHRPAARAGRRRPGPTARRRGGGRRSGRADPARASGAPSRPTS